MVSPADRREPVRPDQSFLNDTLRNAAGSLALSGGRFLAMALMARSLGVESFGVLAVAILCVDLVVLLGLLGLPGVIGRFLPILDSADREQFRSVRWRWLVVSGCFVCVVSPVIAIGIIGMSGFLAMLFMIWALFTALQIFAHAEIQGTLRFDLLLKAYVVGSMVLVAGAGLLFFWPTLLGAVLVMCVSQAVQLLPWMGLRRAGFPAPAEPGSLPEIGQILGYGFNLSLIACLTAIVWSRGELLVVEAILGPTVLGQYGAAVTVSALVWRLTGMLQGAVTPHLSRRLQSEVGIAPFVLQITRLTMAVSSVSALGLACLAPEVMALVFGPEFAPAARMLTAMAPGIVVAGLATGIMAVQFLSEGRVPRNALIGGAVLLGGLAYGLAGPLGGEGAGLARAIAMIAVALVTPLWLAKWERGPLGRQLGLELLVGVLVVASASALLMTTDVPAWLRFALWISASYGLMVRATGVFAPLPMVRQTFVMLRAL